MTGQFSLSLRLSFFYAALFTVIGVQLPYWPLYLSSKGMNAAQIGQILAASYLIKIITNPLVGHAADRHGGRRRPLIALAVVSLASTLLFFAANDFTMVLAVTLISSAAFTAMLPLGDSLTMQNLSAHRLDYGRIRLWGSLAFIVIAGLAGQFLVGAPRSWILWSCLAGQAFTLGTTVLLPDIRSEPAKARAHPIGPLLANRQFLIFLAVTSLTQVSHMIYYGFATLHWRAAGLSGTVIGGLWAEGVVTEVVLFAFGASLVRRLGPRRLLATAGIAGVIRWSVLAVTTDPLLLATVQVLHACTFAANHLGAMHFIARTAPPALSARAQGIYSSIAMGVVPGCAMLVSGRLYEAFGGGAFLAMSALAAGGFLLSFRLAVDGKERPSA